MSSKLSTTLLTNQEKESIIYQADIMVQPGSLFLVVFFSFFFFFFFHQSSAEVGTAAYHSTPYSPTACYGSDPSQFPSSNMFGSAGEGIWDNGAACGRQYTVRCLSGLVKRQCLDPDQTIQITILDRAILSRTTPSEPDATFLLSTTAFAALAKSSAAYVNVEFQLA